MKTAVIGGREVAAGFALAGVSCTRVCTEIWEAKSALKEFADRNDIGVILVENNYAGDMQKEIESLMQVRDSYPLIIAIPSYADKKK